EDPQSAHPSFSLQVINFTTSKDETLVFWPCVFRHECRTEVDDGGGLIKLKGEDYKQRCQHMKSERSTGESSTTTDYLFIWKESLSLSLHTIKLLVLYPHKSFKLVESIEYALLENDEAKAVPT
ncbi:hypothetical protein Prudu_010317, partial [Prunus dulcis]